MGGNMLILGANGRFGSHASEAFRNAGWTVRAFDRKTGDLHAEARRADVIVNAGNPPDYSLWAREMLPLHDRVIAAAKAAGATVIVPGNVYVFGSGSPEVMSETTPHRATNPLGRLRVEMEARYRASGVRTIILRAGDFLDTRASGNWFDKVIVAKAAKGKMVYPGPLDVPHAWAFLPDMARAAVALAERRESLAPFEDVPFPGYALTGRALGTLVGEALGRPVRTTQMAWLPIKALRPFWKAARYFVEMRYLWEMPHRLDGAKFDRLVPGFVPTPAADAVLRAVSHLEVDPDQPVARRGALVAE